MGVGFGPANLALAVALEEHAAGNYPVSAAFFERRRTFGWHGGMLLPSAKMQISFLKDLATFRNPLSRFSFISYLHEVGRLTGFVNNQDFFPTRREFHSYLEWAAARLADRVSYGTEVLAVRPGARTADGRVDRLEVELAGPAGTRHVTTRNLVVSTGLVPHLPVGIESGDERICHSSEFLVRFGRWDHRALRRVAVVGGGQSAAEIVRHLHDRLPHAQVSAVIPAYGYSIADDTPFANRIFDPAAVDDYFYGSDRSRDAFWKYHKNTNYSVVDDEVIRDLFRRFYEDEVDGEPRLDFLPLSRVENVMRVGDDLRVTTHSLLTEAPSTFDVDAVVFATGYRPMDAAGLMGELDGHCARDDKGRYRVDRDYRVVTAPELDCGIYLQGGTEHTHGLSSSLLSNMAVRGGEIADSMVARMAARPQGFDGAMSRQPVTNAR
ncbi:lysine N(6)-hydroxylase/L-ornithine N(5)-oxygenase family protein [Streptomyces sp. NPDC101194]|uniref:lysine N(6)-hydroxylase/L-ornithine N(5)-oxygenase family protein n=1 Tax=Streptomyces sp. NPDC101194 TaxID=3366127 RepID=UPI0037F29305